MFCFTSFIISLKLLPHSDHAPVVSFKQIAVKHNTHKTLGFHAGFITNQCQHKHQHTGTKGKGYLHCSVTSIKIMVLNRERDSCTNTTKAETKT
jgi:hypothetical protein